MRVSGCSLIYWFVDLLICWFVDLLICWSANLLILLVLPNSLVRSVGEAGAQQLLFDLQDWRAFLGRLPSTARTFSNLVQDHTAILQSVFKCASSPMEAVVPVRWDAKRACFWFCFVLFCFVLFCFVLVLVLVLVLVFFWFFMICIINRPLWLCFQPEQKLICCESCHWEVLIKARKSNG